MIAIRFKNVSKAFRLVHQSSFLMREVVRRLTLQRREIELLWALRDVSFEIEKGEAVGLVGTNGAGKSTLLSLIAATSYATSGSVEVEGRVGALLELGAGFHPLLTGLENIVLNASLLGMTREEVEAKLDSIIEYSELRPFIDTSISTYSTGMRARLGFSVLAHMQPEILLIDEALAVGDARFRAKCEATMSEFREKNSTLMIVSHDLRAIERVADRVLWIEKGCLQTFGPTSEVVPMYREHVSGRRGTA